MIFFVIASCLLLFGTMPAVAEYVQIGAVLVLLVGVLIEYLRPLGRREINSYKIDLFSLVLIFVIPVQSVLTGFFSRQDSAAYSLLYICVMLACRSYALSYGVLKAARTYIFVVIAMVSLVFVFENGNLFFALSAVSDEHGLFRFSPFGNHPNLTGHVFGISAVLCFGFVVGGNRKFKEKIFLLTLFVSSVLFVLAASSRGALLSVALAIAAIIFCRLETRDPPYRASLLVRRAYWFGIFVVSAVSAIYLFGYLYQMLDLGSEYRGLDSGGSGRVGNWLDFFSYIFENPRVLLFGNGLRSWRIETLGFDSDNAYINLSYEIGVVQTFVFLFLLFIKLRQLIRCAFLDVSILPVLGVFVFIVIESCFARYLLTIGNPASFLMAIVFLGGNPIHWGVRSGGLGSGRSSVTKK